MTLAGAASERVDNSPVISGALKNGVLYAIAIALARGASILLLPILTRNLNEEELGVYAVLATVLLCLQYVSSGGLDSAATRWFFEHRDQSSRNCTLATWIVGHMTVCAVYALVIVALAPPISRSVFSTTDYVGAIRVAALALPLTVAALIVQHWFRIHERAVPAVVFGIATAVLTVAGTVVCVGPLGLGLTGVFWGQAATGAILTGTGLLALQGKLHLSSFSKARLAEMLKYSLPVLPSVAAIYLLAVLTRLLINGLANTTVVGDYQVVAMLSTGAALFTQAVQQTWEPFALSSPDRDASKPMYRTALVGYFIAAAVLCAAIAAIGPWALQLVGSRYAGFGPELVILCAATLLAGSMPIINTGAAIVGSGRPALVVMGLSVLFNVALAIAWIPRWGLAGAVWASFIAAVVTIPVHMWLVESLWPVGIQLRWLTAVITVGAAGITLVTLISRTELWPFVAALGATAVLAALAILTLARLVAPIRRGL
jgi:O-antigen/teichoic acid export membrane protein